MLASPVRRRALIVASQIALTALAFFGAFAIAYDFSIPATALGRFAATPAMAARDSSPALAPFPARPLLLAACQLARPGEPDHRGHPRLGGLSAAAGGDARPPRHPGRGLRPRLAPGDRPYRRVRIAARFSHERRNPVPVASGRRTSSSVPAPRASSCCDRSFTIHATSSRSSAWSMTIRPSSASACTVSPSSARPTICGGWSRCTGSRCP